MNERIGQNLDIVEGDETNTEPSKSGRGGAGRFLGVQFDCCGVYGRAYLNREGTAYEARCPKCLRRITFRVGEGGTDTRFFTVR